MIIRSKISFIITHTHAQLQPRILYQNVVSRYSVLPFPAGHLPRITPRNRIKGLQVIHVIVPPNGTCNRKVSISETPDTPLATNLTHILRIIMRLKGIHVPSLRPYSVGEPSSVYAEQSHITAVAYDSARNQHIDRTSPSKVNGFIASSSVLSDWTPIVSARSTYAS